MNNNFVSITATISQSRGGGQTVHRGQWFGRSQMFFWFLPKFTCRHSTTYSCEEAFSQTNKLNQDTEAV
jgi:hypothetical protein